MFDLNDLFYFVQVVECLGFAPASRKLGIPKSKLSRRIAGLEERLGVRLIHRSTRTFAVTESGRDYYAHCVAMLVEAEAAEEAILRSKSEPQGRVVISCPPALAAMGFNETIARFAAEHPKVQIQVESTNRRVDPLTENIDIALRVRFPPLEDDGLVVKKLGTVPSVWWHARTWRPGCRRRLLSTRCRHCPASTCRLRITSTAGCWRCSLATMPKYATRRG